MSLSSKWGETLSEVYKKYMITRRINALTGNSDLTVGVTADVANTAALAIDVSQSAAKSIQFRASDITSGNGAFGLEVSNDGVNWIVYNRLVSNVLGNNTQTNANVAAPTLSTDTSSIYFFNSNDIFSYVRVFVNVTTDGTYYATLQLQDNS